jgi:2-dehydropantoate 2-reductase
MSIKENLDNSGRILVVGAGAVGGYFGGRLAEAGRDVTFLVHPSRAQQLSQNGLHILSPHGNVTLKPKLVTAEALNVPYDLVLLSVKAYALDAAINDFAPAVDPETIILPCLNGMHHIDLLTQRFGEHPVIGGVCIISTELDSEGRIMQLSDVQQLTYGERNGKITTRIHMLDKVLRGAGFDTCLSTDIMQAMWEKWVMLASIGAITCLTRGTIGDVVAVPGGPDLSRKMLEECANVATACGHKPSQAFLLQHAEAITTPRSPLTSSMYRDLCKGAPVEVDAILGDLIERGNKHGIATPLLTAAFVNLRVYQAGLNHHTRAESGKHA